MGPKPAPITNCGPGNPDCAVYVTENDCEPGGVHSNACYSSNPNCKCKWVIIVEPFFHEECKCQNVTGN